MFGAARRGCGVAVAGCYFVGSFSEKLANCESSRNLFSISIISLLCKVSATEPDSRMYRRTRYAKKLCNQSYALNLAHLVSSLKRARFLDIVIGQVA